MAGFCRYCGEIPSRCRCASGRPSAVESKTVQALRDSGAGMLAKDRWSSRYTLTRKSPDFISREAQQKARHPARPPMPQRKFTATPGSPPPSTEAEMEAFLSHSFGSVLDPQEEQNKWQCCACQTPFRRDATLYPSDEPTKFYCKNCFSERKSKGNCGTCAKPVLGDVPFVARDLLVWHSSCANCSYCMTNVSDAPTTDPTSKLCCNSCFVSLAWRPPSSGSSPRPAPTSPRKPLPVQRGLAHSSSPSPLRPNAQRKNENPAIEALRKNFSDVGLEKPLQSSPVTRQDPIDSAPPSPVKQDAPRKPLPQPPTDSREPSNNKSKAEEIPSSTCCACHQGLFSVAQHGSKVIKLHDGKTYHSGCFKCAICHKGFSGLQYAIEQEQPVHPECAPEHEPVAVPVVRPSLSSSYLNGQAQPPRPAYQSLPRSKPLPSLVDEASKSYVRPNYTRSARSPLPSMSKLGKGPQCATCGKAITLLDRRVSGGGFEWHEACCTCATCGKQLSSPRVIEGIAKCIGCRFQSPKR